MSHEITSADKVLYARGTETPWHGLATEVDPNKTLCENAIEHGLDWGIRMDQMYRVNQAGDQPMYVEVDNRFAIVRDDVNVVLGVATNDYVPLSNMSVYSSLDNIVSNGLAKPDTMGSLRGGGIVWGLLRIDIPNEEVVSGDSVQRWILYSTGNDGKRGVSIGFVDIRTVCSNTVHAAWSSELSKLISIAHRGNVQANVDAVIKSMDVASREFITTVEGYRRMANASINQADLRKYVKTVMQLEEKENNKRATNLIDHVSNLALTGIGNKGIGDTVWGAFNGITQWMSHEAGRNSDNRFASLWFGQNANMLKRAHAEAMKLAA